LLLSSGTLCYCDEFCDNHINPDCCPDYESFCKGQSLTQMCRIGENREIPNFSEEKVNCNLW
jgi:Somatomedin B domain